MRRLRARPGLAALLLAVVVSIAVATRLPGAVADPLNYDEVLAARAFMSDTPGEAVTIVRRFDSNPPGWYLLAWAGHHVAAAAGKAAGIPALTSAKVPRVFGVLFGGALAGLLLLYARRFLPLWAAALAALLAGVGYQLVEHGKELRPYALLSLAAVAFAFSLEEAARRPTRRRLILLAAAIAVGSVTHYFFLLALAVGFAWLWLSPASLRTRARVTLGFAGGLAPFLVASPVLLHQLFGQGETTRDWIGRFDGWKVADVYGNTFAAPRMWALTADAGRLVVLALVVAGAIVLLRRAEGRLCALLALGPVALAAAFWALEQPVFNERNALVAAPFAAVAIAAGVAAVPQRSAAVAAGAALATAAVAAFGVHTTLGRTSGEEIASELVDLGWSPDAPIVWFGSYWPTSTVAFSLPGRPRLLLSQAGSGPCDELFAVAFTRDGLRWVETHGAGEGARRRAVPFFGSTPRGRRRPYDAVVARVRWAEGAVRAADAAGALHLRSSDGRVPCLRQRER